MSLLISTGFSILSSSFIEGTSTNSASKLHFNLVIRDLSCVGYHSAQNRPAVASPLPSQFPGILSPSQSTSIAVADLQSASLSKICFETSS
ncbi:unnamed protein product [Cuscuta campestris]|uniref:Uncharacterized protein n=1 Tax=Cuscuta campestris TaxID=132261 RepID=A0A484M3U0_9ASTE|nr:unnamed protein product [Cuscuta campestris]